MKKIPTHSYEPLVPTTLRITLRDIAEMDYHFNECPMSNPSFDNAIACALRRIVKPGLNVAVHLKKGEAEADIGSRTCSLGIDIALWLGAVLMGRKVEPVEFEIVLPKSVVRSKPDFRLLPQLRVEAGLSKEHAISA